MNGNHPARSHRPAGRLDDAAIAQNVDSVGLRVLPVEPLAHEGISGVEGGLHPALEALLEDIGEDVPGRVSSGGMLYILGVAPIAHHQLLLGIEHAQPVRHVAQAPYHQEIRRRSSSLPCCRSSR